MGAGWAVDGPSPKSGLRRHDLTTLRTTSQIVGKKVHSHGSWTTLDPE